MDKELKRKEELKAILDANNNLREEIKNWSVSYNRSADMFIAGANFPVGSYYFPVDEGVMLRIDKNKKIYGCAIENAKFFIKNNPQFDLPLSIVVSPLKFYCLYLPMVFLRYQYLKMKAIVPISDYIAARAVFA